MSLGNHILLLKVILAVILFCFSMPLLAAKVSVWVHPAVVKPDETLTLTVSVEGMMRDQPDFSVLEKDFQLLRRSNSSSVDMQRGTTVIKRHWNVVLLPRKMGQTRIPAIQVGNQSTTPLTIEVSNKPAVVNTPNERIFIEIEATPQQPYVNAQVLLAQRLYYAVPLDKAKLSAPVIKDNAAEVVELSTRPTYQRQIAGRRYQVIERNYALFPKKSGAITIEPAEFNGLVPAENTLTSFSHFNLYTRQQQAEHIISKPLTLMVKPQAIGFNAPHWLPASNVTLYGKWSITAGSEVQIGDPIELEMGVVSSGLRPAAIPDVSVDLPRSMKMYTEKPTFDFTTAHSGLSGIRKQKLTFMVTQSPIKKGLIQIPNIRLAWWNTLTEQQEEAVLAGISFKVANIKTASTLPETDNNAPQEQVQDATPQSMTYPLWLGIVSVVVLLLMLLSFYQHYSRRTKRMASPNKPLPPLSTRLSATQLTTPDGSDWDGRFNNNVFTKDNDHKIMNNQPNGVTDKERLTAAVQFACASGKPNKAQQALQQWAEEVADIKPATLSVIATINADFAQQIAYLSQALYAKKVVQWQGEGLWQAVKQYQANLVVPSSKPNGLQDLYPKL